jgi:photosystem II stability/assembly factor-like uncharacterized protein
MDNRDLLLLATAQGVVICERESKGWRVSRRDLAESYVTSVIAQGDTILAGTKDGIYRSGNRGDSWQEANTGLSIKHIRWLTAHPDKPQRIFAGSEPAGIFLTKDGGLSWSSRTEVVEMREQQRWYLPYSPEAGCVRGFAFSGAYGFAAVEVGGALLSNDYGETWTLGGREPSSAMSLHPDVHSIATHPGSGNLVAAPTGGGFFLSTDGGLTWDNRYADCYCRAVWLDPADPDHIILGAADWVDRNGRIEETWDGGLTWSEAGSGLNTPWRTYMVERFAQVGDHLLAVLSNGKLLIATLGSLDWRELLPEVGDVKVASGMPHGN